MLKLHMRQMWEFVAVISPLFNDKQLHTSLPKLYILFWPFSIVYKSPPPPTLILSKMEILPDPKRNLLLIYLYRFKSQAIDTCNITCSFIWVFCLLSILGMDGGWEDFALSSRPWVLNYIWDMLMLQQFSCLR